jgi:uncharacterized RDD family membrane protein YckC
VLDEKSVRAGLWPRAMALFIDGCLITVVLGVLGLVLFVPTGGKIRVAGESVGSQDCAPQNPQVLQELNVSVPPDLHITHVVRCTRSVLGYVHDRVLIVAEITRSGATTLTRERTFPLDTEGRPVRAFYLDSLSGLLFAAYVLLLEWRTGRTLGKDLMDIRVQSLGGNPPNLVQAIKRFFIRFLDIILLEILELIPMATAPGLFWLVVGLLYFVAVLVNFIISVRRNALPWHDRFAGTEVVLGR